METHVTFDSEDAVKRALEIDSWRNLSKDKVLQFAAMMPDMDTEVAIRIIEQFPQFKAFALDALNVLEKGYRSALDANVHSQDAAHRAFQDTRDAIKGQLDRNDLGPDARRHLIECLMELAKMESAKDSENKRFLDSNLGKVVAGAGALALGAVAFVGGKVLADYKRS